jgi:hypothetical protein
MKRRSVVLFILLGTSALGVLAVAVWRASAAALDEPKLVLFWEEGFKGRSLEVTSSLADLPVESDLFGNRFDWNDEVRSLIVVKGTWRLYQHGRLNTRLDETPIESLDIVSKDRQAGWSCLVSATSQGPLEVPSAAVGGFFHDISSIEFVSAENLPDWAAPQWRRER